MEGNAAAPPCNILFIRAGWDEMRCFQKKRKRETTRDCPAAFSSSSSTDGNKSISFHAGKDMQLHTRMTHKSHNEGKQNHVACSV